MKPSEMKIAFYARDLKQCHSFYSVLGAVWLREMEFERNNTLAIEGDSMGLPSLWGRLGDTELVFFSSKEIKKDEHLNSLAFFLNFDEFEAVSEIVRKLKANGQFHPSPDFDVTQGGLVYDPDGRLIHLCGPNPYRI